MNPSLSKDQLASAAEPSVVALAMAGDDGAFEELVRRRQGSIRRLMRQLGGDWTLADDLAQEAFIRAWQKLSTLRAPGAFGGWLRRIAVNVFLGHIRRSNPPIIDSEAVNLTDVENGHRAIHIDLENALARLKAEERICIVLAYGERMSHSEICSALAWPLGTVKSHISRGASRLRRLLKDYQDWEK